MYERILVTGGAGFAGSTLSIRLRAAFPNTALVAFDNLHRRGSELNLDRLRQAGVTFVHGDIRSQEDLASLAPPSLIIECSAEPSAQAGYGGSPAYLMHTNVTGCFHCLELARRHKADFLFLSTSRVYPYGALNALPFRESETRFELEAPFTDGIAEAFPLGGARSLYGMTKLASELMVEEFADAYGFRYIINRFGLLTGPGQMAKLDQGVVALWIAAHYFRRKLSYIGFGGTGKQVRDFLHVDDFCDLVIDQIANFEKYAGRVWNAGGGREFSVSLLELTALSREITGNAIPMGSSEANRPADVRVYVTNHTAVSGVNGWRPRRNAHATAASIYEWLRSDDRLKYLM